MRGQPRAGRRVTEHSLRLILNSKLGPYAAAGARAFSSSRSLLTWTVLDHLLAFLFHHFEVEGSRSLHRRILDCGARQLLDMLLGLDEAPSLAGEEAVEIVKGASVSRLTRSCGDLVVGRRVPEFLHDLLDREAGWPLTWRELLEACHVLRYERLRRQQHESVLDEPAHVIARLVLAPLERIGAQVEQPGRTQRHQRLHPDIETMRLLLHEHSLPILVAKTGKVAVVGPVKELATLVRALTGEKIALVVTVEMNPEGFARGFVTLQELGLDVRLAGRGDERRCPVLGGKDVVDLDAWRHQAWPAHHRRHAVAAFPIGVLLAAERRGAAVGPGEGLRAVVGRVDDDRIIRDAEIVELLQQFANVRVMLHHAVGIDAKPGFVPRLGLEPCPDVHAGRTEPDEERLAVLHCTVNELRRGLQELLIDCLHTLLGEWPGILASLLAPGAKTGIIARRVGRGRNTFENAAWAVLRPE